VLLLFDIDGTLLLKAHVEHRDALHQAIREVWGISEIPNGRVQAAGRTDPAIARSILTLADVDAKRIDDGMGRYFPPGQGGFGSDHEDRAALPAVARRRAGEHHRPYAREKTVVIGDTPLDIQCAHADGVRCIAVATGPYGESDLVGADAIVGAAADIPDALADLLTAAL
jgi:phosphoglycolate phosphatase-like HAD superfamily hydrolase